MPLLFNKNICQNLPLIWKPICLNYLNKLAAAFNYFPDLTRRGEVNPIHSELRDAAVDISSGEWKFLAFFLDQLVSQV